MEPTRKRVVILMADDDEDDRVLAKAAFEESQIPNQVIFVEDGEELLDFLKQRGQYADAALDDIRPGLILLDLNMPRKDGRETLLELKQDPTLKHIPVVVLSTSQADEDISACYQLGANSFITKPTSFEGLVAIMKTVKQYWLNIVRLPE